MPNNIDTLTAALKNIHWKKANQQLLAKIISEFLYEEMLSTTYFPLTNNKYQHTLQVSSSLVYNFIAEKRIFGNWQIDANSIQRMLLHQISADIEVSQFIIDIYGLIGIKGLTLGHLLKELNHTLVADCHIIAHNSPTARELLQLNNYELESCLTGHPWFVINKGRLGFSYPDYLSHAPEMSHPINLSWIAVRKSCADFNAIDTISYESLIHSELRSEDYMNFAKILFSLELSIEDYFLMPVHPWQWENQIINLFPESIVKNDIVFVGDSHNKYLPTQSIRTFSNITEAKKLQVKLSLSIFNTAVYRGLPSDRTRLAPMLTAWLKKKMQADPYFQNECRLILLGEIASIDFQHAYFNTLPGVPYQYKELLGVIWRENVATYLKNSESAITMASLIHLDKDQIPYIRVLIEKANLSIEVWLQKFFKATIPPLLHWLYKYGLVFSPHGENTLLILNKNYEPVGLVIKDFIDDVNLSDRNLIEIEDIEHSLKKVLLRVSDNQLTQFIHTGLFVVLYRYLSNILETYEKYDETLFWQAVHDTIYAYQASHPELFERFEQFDLLRLHFDKMCLNRIRLLSVGYADYEDRPKVDTLNAMLNPANQQVISDWKNMD